MDAGRTPADEPVGRGMIWVVIQIPLLVAAMCLPVWRRLSCRGNSEPGALPRSARGAGVFGLLLSAVLFWDAGRNLGRGLVPYPRPPEGAILRTTGVYAIVRHPIYLGIILTTASWGLLWRSLMGSLSSIPCALFFVLKSRREEQFLLARFPEYAAYRRRVPGLLPQVSGKARTRPDE